MSERVPVLPAVVLVHGNAQGPAGFDPLIAALDARGVPAWAPRIITGTDGAREHADRLAAQLPALDHPVVLAHSAGGLLLPALARRLGAAHQIWLAALVPDHAGRRSMRAELAQGLEQLAHPDWIGVDPTRDFELARHFLFHDAAPDAQAHGVATLALTLLPSVLDEVPPIDPADRPSTYLLPRHDRTLRPAWMARAARERVGVPPVEIAGGHSPYCASPGRIADEIVTVLHRTVGGPA